jgi:hypothetical protein
LLWAAAYLASVRRQASLAKEAVARCFKDECGQAQRLKILAAGKQ